MPSTLIIVTLSLITLLSSQPSRAKHIPDLLESALDSLLCQTADKKLETIIDIKTSIARGASLVDGKWKMSLETCISECCKMDSCDFALYKKDGTSTSGKNCYFVSCGDSMSNCVTVHHTGFISVVIEGRKKESGHEMVSLSTSEPPTPSPTSSTPSPPPTRMITTTSPPHTEPATTSTTKLESHSKTAHVSVPASHFESTTESKPSDQNSNSKSDNNAKAAGGEQGNTQNTNSDNGRSGLIAVAIVGVVCFTIIIIVVAVLARKIWTDHRRKRFRNVDYLINGMYT